MKGLGGFAHHSRIASAHAAKGAGDFEYGEGIRISWGMSQWSSREMYRTDDFGAD